MVKQEFIYKCKQIKEKQSNNIKKNVLNCS